MKKRKAKKFQGRVVAITGGGFSFPVLIGRQLAGDPAVGRVIMIDNEPPPNFPYEGCEFIGCDLMDPASDVKIAEIIEKQHVEIFIHGAFTEAPTGSPQLAHELETVGTMNVLSGCAWAGVAKLMLISHTYLYGASEKNPQFFVEDMELSADRSFQFFADKIEAERLTREFAQNHPQCCVTILRMSPMLGKVESLFAKILGSMFVPVIAGFNPPIQLLHSSDAIRAVKIFMDGDFPGVYNIVGKGAVPFITVVHLLGNIPVPIPEVVFRYATLALYTFRVTGLPPQLADYLKYSFLADGARAATDAGYQPRYSPSEVIDDFYRYLTRRIFEKR